MTEKEQKAIKWIENVRNNAIVTLNHIENEEPNVSPIVYAGRKEKAETILKLIEELQQYQEIGAINEIKRMQKYFVIAKKHGTVGKVIDQCAEYEAIGTVEECRAAVKKQTAKTPDVYGDGYDNEGNIIYDTYDCPSCGKHYEIDYDDYKYCPEYGQAIDWSDNNEK